MGTIIRFPTERIKKKPTQKVSTVSLPQVSWRWRHQLVKAFEQRVMETLKRRHAFFIGELFRTLGMPNSGQLFTILSNLERSGKVEQPERGWYRVRKEKRKED